MKKWIFLICAFYILTGYSQKFNLLPSSSITVDGTSTLLDWTVKAEIINGSINVTTNINTNSNLKKSNLFSISILVPVRNIKSEKGETMDNKMYRALKIEDFPNILYTLIHSDEFTTFSLNDSLINFSGVLNIAGVEKTIHCKTKATFSNDLLILEGEIPLKLSDFNIEPPSAMFGQIETGDDITINFKLEFEK